MGSSYCNLIYHMVFSTKGRKMWIDPTIEARLHEYLGGAIRGEGGVPFRVGGIEDHVHILAKLRQTKLVCDVLRDIKANSSGWVHKTFPGYEGFAWQQGYGAFTVSASHIESVSKYIDNQREHHKHMTFQEEFIGLLEKHGIEYDERYLWD